MLFHFLVIFRGLFDLRVGKHRSGENADGDENCDSRMYQLLQRMNLHLPVGCVQIIDAMTMILPHKIREAMVNTNASPT
jgi:hypothetical protein